MKCLNDPAKLIGSVILACVLLVAISGDDRTAGQKNWTRHLIPLPHKIEVNGSIRLSPQGVSLSLPEMDSPLLQTAAGILRPFAQGRGFEIRGVLTSGDCPDDLKESLQSLPNEDQAYAIRPILQNKRFSGLILAAHTPLGLLYAVRTLAQLIQSSRSPSGPFEIPKLSVLDWPDLAERGEWGGNAAQDLAWLAERKLNVVEVHSQLGFSDDGSPKASLNKGLLDQASRLGIKIVPIILHMEQLAGTGLFRFHPEVAATAEPGKPLPTDYTPAVCFSQAKTAELLSGWMGQLLSLPGVNEVDVWLSETDNRCFCPLCTGHEPFVLETQGILRGFDKARPERESAALRILLTQASYDSNDKVLETVRPDTKVIFYDGGRTYDSSHRPMIYSLLEKYSRSGRWLGVYPQLTNSWRTVFPFTGPQFIQARMREFVDKGLRSFIGYATPSNRYYEFNVTAAAEWSWNSRGRTPREFAEAYAVRAGFQNPEKFAQWAETIGPVGWKLAGSRPVEKLIFGAGGLVFVNGQIIQGRLAEALQELEFGGEMLGEFESEKDFGDTVSEAKKALELAKKIDEPAVIYESQSVLGILDIMSSLRKVAGAATLADERLKRERLAWTFAELDDAARGLTGSIYGWGMTVNPMPRNRLASRFRDTVDFAGHTADSEQTMGRNLGLPDPNLPYRSRQVLTWKDGDFERSSQVTLWADVSGHLSGPGEYDVTLRFQDGASGVATHNVALLYGKDRDTARLIDEDRWDFHIGRFDRYVDYWLTLPKKASWAEQIGDRYFLRIKLTGPDMSAPADRRTCQGIVTLRKSWRS
jgi:hypothetical protein